MEPRASIKAEPSLGIGRFLAKPEKPGNPFFLLPVF
jgi:hypothetical protein